MRKFNITVNGVAYEVEVEEVAAGESAAPAAPKAAAPAPVKAASAPVPEPTAEPAEEDADDLSVVAAITAAIAVLWQEEGHDSGFVVRRVRRVQNSSARARAAREEQIFSHF